MAIESIASVTAVARPLVDHRDRWRTQRRSWWPTVDRGDRGHKARQPLAALVFAIEGARERASSTFRYVAPRERQTGAYGVAVHLHPGHATPL